MKHLLTLSLMTLSLAACGTANDALTSNSSGIKPIRSERALVPVEGRISNVTVHSAMPPAQGLWTEVEVSFIVDCTNTFETASLAAEQSADGRYSILVSAYVSRANIAQSSGDMMVCQASSTETRTVSLPGIVSSDSLNLVQLNNQSADIPNGTAFIRPIGEIKVLSTYSLCTEGASCAFGGTVVILEASLGSCVNALGPISYKVQRNMTEGQPTSVTLTVNAIEFINESAPIVLCDGPSSATARITLPMIYTDEAALNLLVIQ